MEADSVHKRLQRENSFEGKYVFHLFWGLRDESQ